LTLKCGIGFHEAVVDRFVGIVKFDLDDCEGGIDGLKDCLESFLGLLQRDAGEMLVDAVAQDLDETETRVTTIVQGHHLAGGPEAPP